MQQSNNFSKFLAGQKSKSSQQGAVLLVVLIMLLVLTIIGTSGIGTVTLGEKMVSNMQSNFNYLKLGILASPFEQSNRETKARRERKI